MNVPFNLESDTIMICVRDEAIKQSDEARLVINANFGPDGGVVRFEILDFSKRVKDPVTVTLATTR